jgi:hypothetical protein
MSMLIVERGGSGGGMMSGGFEGGFAGGLVGPAAAVFAIFLDGRIVGEFEVGGKVGHGLFWLLTHDDWDMQR